MLEGTQPEGEPLPQGQAPPTESKAPRPAAQRGRAVRRGLVCVLVLYHLTAVTLGNLGETNSVSKTAQAFVNPYLRLFGQWQEWDMFTTIPLYLTLEGKVVARDQAGKETRYDPMLPGFEPQPDSLRVMSMFARIVWARKHFRWHVERFHRAMCRAIAAREGVMPRSVRVELDAMTIRQLSAIKRDGVIGDARVYKSEDAPCPR